MFRWSKIFSCYSLKQLYYTGSNQFAPLDPTWQNSLLTSLGYHKLRSPSLHCWRVTQVSAVVDGPARRAASRISCCRQNDVHAQCYKLALSSVECQQSQVYTVNLIRSTTVASQFITLERIGETRIFDWGGGPVNFHHRLRLRWRTLVTVRGTLCKWHHRNTRFLQGRARVSCLGGLNPGHGEQSFISPGSPNRVPAIFWRNGGIVTKR